MTAPLTLAATASPDLPDAPDCALNYHYGMLLGAADLRTEQGYHVGKQRRHARTLHGRGVVCGLAVSLDLAEGEVRVEPGLALDARGRELALDAAQCVSLPAWWVARRDAPEFAAQRALDVVNLTLEVCLSHRVCYERPVPAIAPTCSTGEAQPLAASRICEGVSLALRAAGDAPGHGVPAHWLPVFALLGIAPAPLPSAADDPDVAWAVQARADVAAAAPEARVAAALAALDRAIARSGARGNCVDAPADDLCLPLAHITGLTLKRTPLEDGSERWAVDAGTVAIEDRPDLLPTGVIQRLLAALLAQTAPAAAPAVVPAPAPAPAPAPIPAPAPEAAAKPLIVAAQLDGNRVRLSLATAIHRGSAQPTAFGVSELDDRHGWRAFTIRHTDPDADGRGVLLTLGHAPQEKLVRIHIDTAGRKPLLAADSGSLAAYDNAFTISL